MKQIILLSLFCLFFIGCGKKEQAPASTKIERIAKISKLISLNTTLPSSILDAEYIEFQKGDGVLGPSDYNFYSRITVKPIEVKKWIKGLKKPFNNTTKYSKPKTAMPNWWLTEKSFNSANLFETKTYFNRYNGWISVDSSKGFLYVYTFTM